MHKAKKSLGQNFLKSEAALRKIIEVGEIKIDDIILEIGPGKGALTKKLLEKAGLVIAVEKDRELFEFLKEKFSEEIKVKKLILINDDILKIDVDDELFSDSPQKNSPENLSCSAPSLLPRVRSKTIHHLKYKIIANIPYNITGAILKKFLTEKIQPESMVLMVQHEVAKRIMGRGNNPSTSLRMKESILSISVKAYGEPKIAMKVPARYFSPAPKVDSAIISIKNINREIFIKNNINEEKFWEIVKTGFAHKRKKLSSNLKILKKNTLIMPTIELGNKRAEELTLLDWISLAQKKL